mmetsp:Transcript_23208/g.58620  ORF Transcript_23208/g.58620 Transcript_23208/m.58620 type:complete len:286 (+) Transcript_23208:74-931(+)
MLCNGRPRDPRGDQSGGSGGPQASSPAASASSSHLPTALAKSAAPTTESAAAATMATIHASGPPSPSRGAPAPALRRDRSMVSVMVTASVLPWEEAGGSPSRHLHRLVPPQTSHASVALPLYIFSSHPVQLEPSPPQIPQMSLAAFPPSHTPHRSNFLPELTTPSHPRQRLLSPSHCPHRSNTLPLMGLPSHPRQEVESPPHLPHASWNTPHWHPLVSAFHLSAHAEQAQPLLTVGHAGEFARHSGMSKHVELSPLQTPQRSYLDPDPDSPSHPCLHMYWGVSDW